MIIHFRCIKKKHVSLLLCLSLILASCAQRNLKVGQVNIIPLPLELTTAPSHFLINSRTTVSVSNEEQLKIATRFFEKFNNTSGWIPKIGIKKANATIIFLTDDSLEDEAYELTVTKESIHIKSASGAGFFYAMQSLGQLLPPTFYSQKKQPKTNWGIPIVTIKDKPAFGWRGYMLDVSRHFFNKEEVKEVIDFMAEMKLNRFHWHLSDDNGWRIEIKKYPKLTEVGAWRINQNAKDENTSNWWGRPRQNEGDKPTYGGFYTQEDIKEIVAYAKERYIEIIPEIDMPGHSLAAIAAYPEISCSKGPFYVGTGGVKRNNTYCPGKEVTFEFVEGVLGEVMDLFPYEYMHIGGDECNKEAWEVDPHCQQRMKEENLADTHELQSYFVKRVEKIVNARHKNMIGWDEILEGGLAPNATVMSWRGEKGGIAAARQGHDVIMTPSMYCYLDLKQGDDDIEPNLGYAYTFLKDTYNYKIISDSLTTEQGKHVLGLQGNLWTESITNWGQLTYMTFPRLYAVAENGWTNQKSKDWNSFTTRLLSQFKRLDAKGERYATSAYNVRIDHKGQPEGTIEISLKTEVDGLDIYYTLDSTSPNIQSIKYTKPFKIDKTSTLKATSFIKKEQIGNISERYFPVHKGIGAEIVYHSPNIENNTSLSGLVDLNYGKLNRGDKNWNTFNDDLDVDILFPEPKEIQTIDITSLRFTIGGIYVPENYEIFGSQDGVSFTKLTEVELKEASHTQGRNKVKTTINFDKTTVKALKIKAKHLNPIPDNHHEAGKPSRILIDEIVIF
ncbi:beta-N-acetylhexosaminidase [Mariniflexile sp. AS56]|uniref:beta-N-acetylhexosaminidase n=1 Tax=Mariniflexile sp. AS56 TaxID=3063957 RepID=UPI0026EEE132|nr:family 20 glycosylhydrolase [Mariniflexile sp. AS56]MDO7172656.1 family 20 glycosylhydrolase [Mariniflexile sp. AS56]